MWKNFIEKISSHDMPSSDILILITIFFTKNPFLQYRQNIYDIILRLNT